MPRPTSKLMPIIVYVPKDEFELIQQAAREEDRSVSYVARRILVTARSTARPKSKRS